MILMPQQAIAILLNGGGLRISTKGMLPITMMKYAAAARKGGARLEFVLYKGRPVMPDLLNKVAAAGGRTVAFDFAN
jgi:hypothetical protein